MMATSRPVKSVTASVPTMEGAGVSLRRAFGQAHPDLDPFLLLDDFHSDDPDDYRAGFPWHPHRGIETISYMIEGYMAHGDSLGNDGMIGPGDVQWMTAGGGIVHQEMPGSEDGTMWGLQLWSNLPATDKMMAPRYRDVTADTIPGVALAPGVTAKIVCGELGGTKGPVQDVVTEPSYWDVTIEAHTSHRFDIDREKNAFAYVLAGSGSFDEKTTATEKHLVVFGVGDEIVVITGGEAVRFLLIAGKPLREPVAWRGPIVMNTEEELATAFREYREGTFLKHEPKGA